LSWNGFDFEMTELASVRRVPQKRSSPAFVPSALAWSIPTKSSSLQMPPEKPPRSVAFVAVGWRVDVGWSVGGGALVEMLPTANLSARQQVASHAGCARVAGCEASQPAGHQACVVASSGSGVYLQSPGAPNENALG
jgi:hypothetical protein